MSDQTERLIGALSDRYRVIRRLGEGGMATVYLAEDLKHKRQVALKVLRPELAAVLGGDRFVQEITTTASLQHPHILPLFDSGEADGFLYYVMPFIDGETLRDKLDHESQLGIDDAVRITVEIADALDYAHRQGVIHRDIKPENILLHDGRPMVADFGIALAVSAAAGGRMTETGLSLGTPHYMSPEQATAEKDLTNKSDIYSLGSMLYEMLTGNPPHVGSTAQQIIMKIVTEDVAPVTNERKTVPPHVAAAVAQSLEKLPADRFATAGDFAAALNNPSFTSATVASSAAVISRGRSSRLVLALAVTTVLGLAGTLWGLLRPTPTREVRSQRIVIGGVVPGQLPFQVDIAPDGAIAFIDTMNGGLPALWVKEPASADPTPVVETPSVAGIAFSPDGSWITYAAGGKVFKVARAGGSPVQLVDGRGTSAGKPVWLENGSIVFTGGNGATVYSVSENGGPSRRVLSAIAEFQRGVFRLAPLSRSSVLASTVSPTLGANEILSIDLESGVIDTVVVAAAWAEYLPDGNLLYASRDGNLWIAPYDPRDGSLGEASTVGITTSTVAAGAASAVLGRDGTFLFGPGNNNSSNNLAQLDWVDRAGRSEVLDDNLGGIGLAGGLRLSPDGTRATFSLAQGQGLDLFVTRLPGGPSARVTFDGRGNRRAEWSPDGTRLLYISSREGGKDRVWTRRTDGAGSAELVLEEERGIFEAMYSPDGRWIIYRTDDDTAEGRGDIYAVRTNGDSTIIEITATPAEETAPALSPDGRFIAYSSDESGQKQVYVRPFPNAEAGKWLVSIGGGEEAAWSPTGNELFYYSGNRIMKAARYTTSGNVFEVLERTDLFDARNYLGNDDGRYYDVSADGQRFLMIGFSGAGSSETPVMISNFFEMLGKSVSR